MGPKSKSTESDKNNNVSILKKDPNLNTLKRYDIHILKTNIFFTVIFKYF